MTAALPYLLRKGGFQDVSVKGHALEIGAELDGWTDFYQTADITSIMLTPFFVKTQVASKFLKLIKNLWKERTIMIHYSTLSAYCRVYRR
jgi:hypothetical protein